MTISPGSSPADTVNPVTGSRQSGSSDCADTTIAVNARMAATANATTNTPTLLLNIFILRTPFPYGFRALCLSYYYGVRYSPPSLVC